MKKTHRRLEQTMMLALVRPRHQARAAAALLLSLSLPLQAQSPVTQYEYDAGGNHSKLTDPLNRITRHTYDALDRLTQTTDAANGVVRYGYDALGRLVSVTDPRNLATAYIYNGLGDLVTLASPDTGTTQNTYDAAGNLLTSIDAKGQTTSYQYDAANRVTSIRFADAQVTQYAYDEGSNGAGRLTGITHIYPAGHPFAGMLTMAFAYDALGRRLSESWTLPSGASTTLAYQYDSAGRLIGTTYPSGRQVAYGYDAAGRVSEIGTTANGQTQTVATGISYRPFGPAAAHAWGNSVAHTRDFDTEGRQVSYPMGASRTLLGYDAASNIAWQADAGNAALTTGYSYDALDRLGGQNEPGTIRSWGYDAAGNRTSQSVGGATTAFQYGVASNRLINAGGRAVASDANGAITDNGQNVYKYDARGRLVASVGAAGTTHYLIDPFGRRLVKRGPLGATAFVYDMAGHLIAELDEWGNTSQEHLWANDAPLAVAVPQTGGAAEIILDNAGPAFAATGTWAASSAVAGYYGANYRTHPGADSPAGITVDNSDAGFSVTGAWSASTAVSGYQGTDYLTHPAGGDPLGTQLIDNPAGSASGNWPISTSVSGYAGSNYQTHAAGTGSSAFTWTASLSPGQYRVYARWTANPNRASDAKYTVVHPGGQDIVTVNQQQNGATWNLLGTYTFDATGAVTLTDQANGYVIADAVKFVPTTGAPPTATWTAALTPGQYQVYAKWTANPNRASDAKYTVAHTGGQDTVTVNQQQNGATWNLLGTYTFDATGSATLTDQANGYVIADAVKFVAEGTAFDSATWRPNVSGTYDIYARWTAHPNRASDAKYTFAHRDGQSTVTVNQQAYGGTWSRLGTFTLVPQSAISLSSQANGYVIADALRLLPTAPDSPALLHYVHTDHLGTPRAVTTQQAATIWRWEGEAFGNSPATEDPDGDGLALAYNLRFPGQYYDRETGTHYNYFRDYDPQTGRYIQSDPIGLKGGINTYTYVGGNPLSFADPLGLDPATGTGGSTRYGNWCGRNWSGGCQGPIIPSSPVAPIDSVDSCCMAHDYCYAKFECENCMPEDKKKAGKKECDKVFVSCVEKLKGKDPRTWPQPPPPGTASSAYFFSQKAKWWFKD